MAEDTITLRLVQHGETSVSVDRADYEAAKQAEELDQFLDVYTSNMETCTQVFEADGTEVYPYR